MWLKYLPLAAYAYNIFNTPNIGNFSPYKLVFGTKPKPLLNLETMPDIKISGTFKDYYELLNISFNTCVSCYWILNNRG